MHFINFIYFMVYCCVREDNNSQWPRHERAAYLIDGILAQILFTLIMIVLGFLGVRMNHILMWIILVVLTIFISFKIVNSYYITSGRYKNIIFFYEDASKSKRLLYVILSILMFLSSFTLMFFGGMLMSYLLSLHLK